MAQDDLPMSIAVAGQAERAYGGIVSGNFFHVMGVQPALGRVLSVDDDRNPGGHPVVVISDSYWRRRFGADPAVIGREVTINSVPMTVIGVTPPEFVGSFLGINTSAWVPMAMQAEMTGASRLEARGSGWMQTLARLRPGVSEEQAQAEASALLAQIAQEHAGSFDGWRVRVLPPWRPTWGAPSALAPILGVLSVVVSLVLLIACANVANLLLARAVGRRREIAVRLSLGADRLRLVRQLMSEAMLLSVAAGVVGIAIAYWTLGLVIGLGLAFAVTGFMRSLLPGIEPRDPLTFIGVPALLMVIALIAALIPARRAGAVDPVVALRYE